MEKGKEDRKPGPGRGQSFRWEKRGEALGFRLNEGFGLKVGVKVEVGPSRKGGQGRAGLEGHRRRIGTKGAVWTSNVLPSRPRTQWSWTRICLGPGLMLCIWGEGWSNSHGTTKLQQSQKPGGQDTTRAVRAPTPGGKEGQALEPSLGGLHGTMVAIQYGGQESELKCEASPLLFLSI